HTALCEEHLGRLKAALEDYKAAAAQAHDENAADVLRLVDRRLSGASDRVPRLVVVLVPSVPDATILVDGNPVAPGEAVSVDPGEHIVEARAAGRTPAHPTVPVVERPSTSVEFPLEPVPAPPPEVPAPPPPASPIPSPSPASRD